jgi:hypothetical protein
VSLSPVGTRLPGQLDLKFGAVILDLKFHFQMDLIGDVRDEPEVPTFDHDIVVGGELVRDRVQPGSRRLPSEGGLLLQLHKFHVTLRSSVECLSVRLADFGQPQYLRGCPVPACGCPVR